MDETDELRAGPYPATCSPRTHRAENAPIYMTLASASAVGAPRAAAKARPYRRPVVPGVFAHPDRTMTLLIPTWADHSWMRLRDLTAALQTRRPDMVLSHRSAARLHGLPLPLSAQEGSIDVTPHSSYTKYEGFRCHRVKRIWAEDRYGVTVATPGEVLRQIAGGLTDLQLLQVAEALCGPWRGPALTTPDGLHALIREWPRFSGRRRLLSIMARVRAEVGSPQETALRIALVDAGLPEPLVAHPVDVGFAVFHPDLSYPEAKIALEYEGLHHLKDAQQWSPTSRGRRRCAAWAGPTSV
jgi:hypothetical protein